MTVYAQITEEQIAESLMSGGLLDVLGLLAMEATDSHIKRMVDDQFSGSIMHSEIPDFLRKLASEIENEDRA